MKSMKKTLSCILALTIAASMYAMPAYAQDDDAQAVAAVETADLPEEEPETCENDEPEIPAGDLATEGDFTIDSKGVLTKYSGSASNLVIPPTIAGITVKVIGEDCFRPGVTSKSTLQSVVIPDTVTEIHKTAFFQCTSLASVTFSKNLKTIGKSAFRECSNLLSVQLPDSVETVEDSAFGLCSSLSLLSLGNGVKSIGNSAFSSAKIATLVIPDSVTEIKARAFTNCSNLARLTLSKNLETLESEAFNYCGALKSVNIPGKVKTIGNKAFERCVALETVTLNSGTEVIHNWCFYNCDNLKKINLPGTLKTIGCYAFSGTGIESIVIPDSVTHLGDADMSFNYCGVFRSCSNLKTVKIGKGLKQLGDSIFEDCRSLTEIDIPSNIEEIGLKAFAGNYKLTKVTLHEGLKTIGAYAFYNSGITRIIIPDSVYKLEEDALFHCDSLEEVTIGSGILSLEYNLSSEKSLRTVHLHKNLQTIAITDFYDCPLLRDIYYSGTIAEWNNFAEINSTKNLIKDKEKYVIHCSNGTITGSELRRIVGIEVYKPNKTEYQIGDELDVTGGQVGLTFSDDKHENIPLTKEMCTGFDSKTAGTKTITVTYEGFTDTFTVTVKGAPEKTVKSISVIPPTKTQYLIGDTLDVTGGFVTIQYSDNSSESIPLEASMCSGFSSKTAGDKTVTVKYGGKTATFKVTVNKQSEDPSKSGVKLNGEAVASYEAAIKSIGTKKGEYTLTIDAPITVSKFTFPKNAKLEIIATENGGITTTAASLAPSAPLVIECPITNSKGKAVAINAKSDLTVTGGSFGNITVKGKASIADVIVNGTLKLSAKADKYGLTTDTLTGVTATKGVSSNNNVIFADCPSLGTINVKGTVNITGDATKAVALTASSKTGISEVENLTVGKKVSIAGNLIASGLTASNAVDVKGNAKITDSTIAGKLNVKGVLSVNDEVYCANAVSCAQLTSDAGAHLTYQTLAVTKNGIASDSADITVKVIDKNGAPVNCNASKKNAIVVKSFKLPKGGKYNAVLILDEACGTGTLTFEKNKIILI